MQLKPIEITTQGRSLTHLLESSHQWAIRAAVGAQRPLLVLGEPGVGKSQLALAAGRLLNRPIIRFTVDSNTEATDLLYRYDSVRRLAEAQVQGSAKKPASTADQTDESKAVSNKDPLAIDNFVSPGPLWWALDWHSALSKSPAAKPEDIPKGWQESQGVVILIDEIDKADAHVPNGLLEVLGENRFLPLGRETPIRLNKDHAAPLIVITSNEDRVLPPAFVRRCVVLKIDLPGGTASEIEKNKNHLVDYLEQLGQAHFEDQFGSKADGKTVYRTIAEQLAEDRLVAIQQSLRPFPGPAEYLDILRAIEKIAGDIEKDPAKFEEFANVPMDQIHTKLAEELRSFVFKKSSKRS
ncbi:MAG: AAA family ATPase [Planctomycetota bacterium]